MTTCTEVLKDNVVPNVMVTGLSAGLGAGIAAAGAFTALTVATGAIFGGATWLCATTLSLIAEQLGIIKDAADFDLAYKIMTLALLVLSGAAITMGIATLAGFTITVLDALLLSAISASSAITYHSIIEPFFESCIEQCK